MEGRESRGRAGGLQHPARLQDMPLAFNPSCSTRRKAAPCLADATSLCKWRGTDLPHGAEGMILAPSPSLSAPRKAMRTPVPSSGPPQGHLSPPPSCLHPQPMAFCPFPPFPSPHPALSLPFPHLQTPFIPPKNFRRQEKKEEIIHLRELSSKPWRASLSPSPASTAALLAKGICDISS